MAVVEHRSELDDMLLDDRLRELEMDRRRVVAEQALAIAAAEARQLHVADGHHSMNPYLRATLNCSSAEASTWRRLGKLLDTVPGYRSCYCADVSVSPKSTSWPVCARTRVAVTGSSTSRHCCRNRPN